MDNSYFLYSATLLKFNRLHISSWEFRNNTSLIEFGWEIDSNSIQGLDNIIEITLLIPWLTNSCSLTDIYSKLKESSNSRFIFNDAVTSTEFLDPETDKLGVLHKFTDRNDLCILPIKEFTVSAGKLIINIDLNFYRKKLETSPNIYIRFSIKPSHSFISTRKKGIGKSTIIYDIKINEKRNIPKEYLNEVKSQHLCNIIDCFFFNIVPNNYDIVFFDTGSLKNVRTLEHIAFNRYLGDVRIKKDELMVVFNKRQHLESFSFFSIYSREHIGAAQFAFAIMINILCSLLIWLSPIMVNNYNIYYGPILALIIALSLIAYFLKPLLKK